MKKVIIAVVLVIFAISAIVYANNSTVEKKGERSSDVINSDISEITSETTATTDSCITSEPIPDANSDITSETENTKNTENFNSDEKSSVSTESANETSSVSIKSANETSSVTTGNKNLTQKIQKVEEEKPVVQQKIERKVFLGNYSGIESYNNYTDSQIVLIKEVIKKIEFCKSCNYNVSDADVAFSLSGFTFDDFKRMRTFFIIYYGDFYASTNFTLTNANGNVNEQKTVGFSVNKIKELETRRDKQIGTIENIISNFSEGTEEEKLQQVADYFKANVTYSSTKHYVDDVLYNHQASCSADAFTFKMFAQRLGIKCDFVVGYENNVYHAWNKVTFSNGRVAYYDMTLVKHPEYVNSVNQIHDMRLVNDFIQ